MPKPRKLKTQALTAPLDQAEAEAILAEIGKLQRQVTGIQSDMNNELTVIKDRYEKLAQPINEEIETKFQALHIYAEANKSILLKGKIKTAKLSTGELIWRTSPKKVNLSKVETIIKALKANGLGRFIRTKDEVDKEAVLAEPEAVEQIKGIKITQAEVFAVIPYESKIERAETIKSKKKAKAA